MSIQPGTYTARATSAVLAFTNNGSEQVAVAFVLLDSESKPTNVHVTWYGYFTDKTTARTIESLRHCGWQGDDFSDLSTVGTQDVEIVVDDERDDRDGTMRTRVRWVNSLGSSGPAVKNVMDEASRKAFAARMRGVVVAANGGNVSKPVPPKAPSRQPQQPASPAADYADDDIPF